MCSWNPFYKCALNQEADSDQNQLVFAASLKAHRRAHTNCAHILQVFVFCEHECVEESVLAYSTSVQWCKSMLSVIRGRNTENGDTQGPHSFSLWPAAGDGAVAPCQYESLCCAHKLPAAATEHEPDLGWMLKCSFRIQDWIPSCCESVQFSCFLQLCSLHLSNPLVIGGAWSISALLCGGTQQPRLADGILDFTKSMKHAFGKSVQWN